MTDDLLDTLRAWLAASEGMDAAPILRRTMVAVVARVEAFSPLAWSDAKPTVPGWYWWRQDSSYASMVVDVDSVNSRGDLNLYTTKWHQLSGQFAGPIPPPRTGDAAP